MPPIATLVLTSCVLCVFGHVKRLDRVAANLENLEYSRDFSAQGKLREFCATPGKNCNKHSLVVCIMNVLLFWRNKDIYIYIVILERQRNFFSYFVAGLAELIEIPVAAA